MQHTGITTLLNPRSQNVPKTKVERAKLVEITEDRRKLLVVENFDYPLATIHKNINFDTKFPSWTSRVRSPSPAPKFSKINFLFVE